MNKAKSPLDLTWTERIAAKIQQFKEGDALSFKSLLDSLTLIDAFWILRSKCGNEETSSREQSISDDNHSLESLKQLLDNRNSIWVKFKNVFPQLKELREQIGCHYAKLIQKDYEYFIMAFMDDLYKNQEILSADMSSLFSSSKISNDTKIFLDCFNNILSLIKDLQTTLAGQEENILALIKAIDVDPASKCEFCLSDVPRASDCLEQPRYAKFLHEESTHFDRSDIEAIKNANKQIFHLREGIRSLVNFEDGIYCSVRKTFEPLNLTDSILEKLFIQLEYLIVPQFNLENILLFIFLDDMPSSIEPAQIVIKKHENFFENILKEIKIKGQVANVNRLLDLSVDRETEAITENHVSSYPQFMFEPSKSIIFFRLKKILSLFSFYNASSKRTIPKEIDKIRKFYQLILIDTNLSNTAYNCVLDSLPEYLINLLGINNSNLATLLGITEKTVTAQIKNGTILRKHLWFWQAVTGYSNTYLQGETTIPYYGITDTQKNAGYLISVVTVKAYAEIIINRILAIVRYQKALAKSPKVVQMRDKKYALSAPYLNYITKLAYNLVNDILPMRTDLEHLLEKKRGLELDIKANNTTNTQSSDKERKLQEENPTVDFTRATPEMPGLKKSKTQSKRNNNPFFKEKEEEIQKINQMIEAELTTIVKRLKGISGELDKATKREIQQILNEQEKYDSKG